MFITIDGRHGVGKSFLIDKLYDTLVSKGFSVVKTKEPTETKIGLFAREALESYQAETLACLFAADRREHCMQIKKWIADGKIVLCDRYIISGLVLQSMDGVSFEYTNAINTGIISPDISLVLHAKAEVIYQRLQRRCLSRLMIMERNDPLDRYQTFETFLKEHFNEIYYFEHNTEQDSLQIELFVINRLLEDLNENHTT